MKKEEAQEKGRKEKEKEQKADTSLLQQDFLLNLSHDLDHRGGLSSYLSNSSRDSVREHIARWKKGEEILAKLLKEGKGTEGWPMIEVKKKRRGKETDLKKKTHTFKGLCLQGGVDFKGNLGTSLAWGKGSSIFKREAVSLKRKENRKDE